MQACQACPSSKVVVDVQPLSGFKTSHTWMERNSSWLSQIHNHTASPLIGTTGIPLVENYGIDSLPLWYIMSPREKKASKCLCFQNEKKELEKTKFHVTRHLDTPAQPFRGLSPHKRIRNALWKTSVHILIALPRDFHFAQQKKTGNLLSCMADYLWAIEFSKLWLSAL